ncbi:SCY1-like protein 2, partial [Biomphalaria pfeifferi]
KMLYNNVLPELLNECKSSDSIVYALPTLITIIDYATRADYVDLIMPDFRAILANTKPVQATVYILNKLDILLTKSPMDEIKGEILPFVFNTLDSSSLQAQEAALGAIGVIKEYLDDNILRKVVLPKAKSLFFRSNNVKIRINALTCIDHLLDSLDKMLILDNILPFLANITAQDPDVIMCIVVLPLHPFTVLPLHNNFSLSPPYHFTTPFHYHHPTTSQHPITLAVLPLHNTLSPSYHFTTPFHRPTTSRNSFTVLPLHNTLSPSYHFTTPFHRPTTSQHPFTFTVLSLHNTLSLSPSYHFTTPFPLLPLHPFTVLPLYNTLSTSYHFTTPFHFHRPTTSQHPITLAVLPLHNTLSPSNHFTTLFHSPTTSQHLFTVLPLHNTLSQSYHFTTPFHRPTTSQQPLTVLPLHNTLSPSNHFTTLFHFHRPTTSQHPFTFTILPLHPTYSITLAVFPLHNTLSPSYHFTTPFHRPTTSQNPFTVLPLYNTLSTSYHFTTPFHFHRPTTSQHPITLAVLPLHNTLSPSNHFTTLFHSPTTSQHLFTVLPLHNTLSQSYHFTTPFHRPTTSQQPLTVLPLHNTLSPSNHFTTLFHFHRPTTSQHPFTFTILPLHPTYSITLAVLPLHNTLSLLPSYHFTTPFHRPNTSQHPFTVLPLHNTLSPSYHFTTPFHRIYKHMLSDKKFGLTHNLLATKVMPSLIPHTVNPGLTMEQFTSLVEVLREMLEQVDKQRRDKMKLETVSLPVPPRGSLKMMNTDNESDDSLPHQALLIETQRSQQLHKVMTSPGTPETQRNKINSSPKANRKNQSLQCLGMSLDEKSTLDKPTDTLRRHSLVPPPSGSTNGPVASSNNPTISITTDDLSPDRPRRPSTHSLGPFSDLDRRGSRGSIFGTLGLGDLTGGSSHNQRRPSFQAFGESVMQLFDNNVGCVFQTFHCHITCQQHIAISLRKECNSRRNCQHLCLG